MCGFPSLQEIQLQLLSFFYDFYNSISTVKVKQPTLLDNQFFNNFWGVYKQDKINLFNRLFAIVPIYSIFSTSWKLVVRVLALRTQNPNLSWPYPWYLGYLRRNSQSWAYPSCINLYPFTCTKHLLRGHNKSLFKVLVMLGIANISWCSRVISFPF